MRPPLLLALALVACAAPAASPSTGVCAGEVEPLDGFEEIADPGLLRRALGAPGDGKLCTGKVFAAVKPVTVYRVWNASAPDTRLGQWWALAPPRGPADAYRAQYAICPEWNPLDRVSACRLKVGARVVVGPGQSATCKQTSYRASPANQVFIPNDAADPAKVLVEDCTPGAAFH